MTATTNDPRVETVKKLRLRKGDVLHVTLGIADLGDDQGPWIPDSDQLVEAHEIWQEAVPDGVNVVVSHIGEDVEVIRKVQNA